MIKWRLAHINMDSDKPKIKWWSDFVKEWWSDKMIFECKSAESILSAESAWKKRLVKLESIEQIVELKILLH